MPHIHFRLSWENVIKHKPPSPSMRKWTVGVEELEVPKITIPCLHTWRKQSPLCTPTPRPDKHRRTTTPAPDRSLWSPERTTEGACHAPLFFKGGVDGRNNSTRVSDTCSNPLWQVVGKSWTVIIAFSSVCKIVNYWSHLTSLFYSVKESPNTPTYRMRMEKTELVHRSLCLYRCTSGATLRTGSNRENSNLQTNWQTPTSRTDHNTL